MKHLSFSKIYSFFKNIRLVIGIPYGWLLVFFFIPVLIILKISFSKPIMAIPPFEELIRWSESFDLEIRLHLSNYLTLVKDPFYGQAFLSSVVIAASSTMLCLIIGYAMAYGMTRFSGITRIVCLMMVMLPFWTSFLVRVYAWLGLLSNGGIVNTVLLSMGLIREPLALLHNDIAVCIGITYCYLPFMILPIFSSLDKLDPEYLEAAHDLGCSPLKAFWKVTVPLTKPGIIAGCVLVFVPALGEFVIPELLGGPDTLMIGRIIWNEFFNNRDWPVACALAVVLLLTFVAPIMAFQRRQLSKSFEEGA
ncbi:MAG TPA: ABC transporter permease subunit [Alphaproteobacteria bacterium]|nr:ABC transporter permease subunit [Alphaproteobacteria bacterium]